MNTARFFFERKLDHFLAPSRAGQPFDYAFEGQPSVKHLIEALGVPHTEVGAIRINGKESDFDAPVSQGDRVEVAPASKVSGIQPPAARFILDNHLGRLAAYLRMLGFDCLYRNDYQDEELAQVAAGEERILLTRDRRLLMRRAVRYGYCLRSLDSREQLEEVLNRFDLFTLIQPFQRCLHCNTPLEPAAKAGILHRLQPLTRQYYEEFHICPACNQIYWKGSHYEHMQSIIDQIVQNHQDRS